MKTFQEFVLGESTLKSDPDGPGKGKSFDVMSADEHNAAIEHHKTEILKLKGTPGRTSHNTQNHIRGDASQYSKGTRSLGGNFKAKADMNFHINKLTAHQDHLDKGDQK